MSDTERTQALMRLHGIKDPAFLGSADPFNLSNDHWYQLRGSTMATIVSLRKSLDNRVVDHAPPAAKLVKPFFETNLDEYKLRHFHRMPLSCDPTDQLCPVEDIEDNITLKAKQREEMKQAGQPFAMKLRKDMSARDGTVILTEYSEEHPPLIMRSGMCSHIINYFKRAEDSEEQAPAAQFGSLKLLHDKDESPFLGKLAVGGFLQSLENNMFRAPIYHHKPHPTDFLLIRVKDKYYLREVAANFVVGQECPKVQVPAPNSKMAEEFVRDRFKWYILRTFRKAGNKSIRTQDVMHAFPTLNDTYIRHRLGEIATFIRGGAYDQTWQFSGKEEDLTDEYLNELMTPERVCAYESMQEADLRLKDAGFRKKLTEDKVDERESTENDEIAEITVGDEVNMAPWHTTINFIQCMKGECLLAVAGPAEPTGQREGFSYLRMPMKPFSTVKDSTRRLMPKLPSATKAEQRGLVGTEFDLRGLSEVQARDILVKKHGFTRESLVDIKRWELVHLIRETETRKFTDSEVHSKFVRTGKSALSSHRERFNQECQRIFDLQNKMLASEEDIKTDDGGSSDEDEDADNDILTAAFRRRNESESVAEARDQAEAEEFRKRLEREKAKASLTRLAEERPVSRASPTTVDPPRKLVIRRTFSFGVREEVVTDQRVIDAYLNYVDDTDNAEAGTETAGQMPSDKLEARRARRRVQDRARRARLRAEKMARLEAGGFDENATFAPSAPTYRSASRMPKNPERLTCGNCRAVGHTKTNKQCPKYYLYEKELLERERADMASPVSTAADAGVKVDNLKITFSKALVEKVGGISCHCTYNNGNYH